MIPGINRPSPEAEVSIANLRPRLPSDRGLLAERALCAASFQRGLATGVFYTNDESPELVPHEGLELFR
jgi:hypothetical protein